MTRQRRSFEQHGWFHVTNRGVDRQDIFSDIDDRQIFLDGIGAASDRHQVEVHAFSLMSNHFHLLVHCPDGELSDFVQRLLQRFAIRHNARVEREGHLFSGRFRSTVIEDDNADPTVAFMMWARYIHRNPLDRLQLEQLAHDPFSSYGAYVGIRQAPAWLTMDRLLGCHAGRSEMLRAFTERSHPSDTTSSSGRRPHDPSPQAVVAAVAHATGCTYEAVLVAQRGHPNPSRAIAAHLAYRLRSGTTAQLADFFGLASQSAFRRLAARGKDRLALEPVLASIEVNARRALRTQSG